MSRTNSKRFFSLRDLNFYTYVVGMFFTVVAHAVDIVETHSFPFFFRGKCKFFPTTSDDVIRRCNI